VPTSGIFCEGLQLAAIHDRVRPPRPLPRPARRFRRIFGGCSETARLRGAHGAARSRRYSAKTAFTAFGFPTYMSGTFTGFGTEAQWVNQSGPSAPTRVPGIGARARCRGPDGLRPNYNWHVCHRARAPIAGVCCGAIGPARKRTASPEPGNRAGAAGAENPPRARHARARARGGRARGGRRPPRGPEGPPGFPQFPQNFFAHPGLNRT
jgi:hypothetical protein